MDKKLIVRMLCLVFALLNAFLTLIGVNPIAISNDVAYEIISIAVTVVVVFWNAWKNNNFTQFAKLAQKVLDALKSGKITSEMIEKFLTEKKE